MLDQELGLLPGQELQLVHRRVLAEAGELAEVPASAGGSGAPGPSGASGPSGPMGSGGAPGHAGPGVPAGPPQLHEAPYTGPSWADPDPEPEPAGASVPAPRSPQGVRSPNPSAPWMVQRQLPPEATHFVGREHHLAELTTLLTPRQRTSVPLVSIVGPPGIGKTSLALRTAHRLSTAYPDGQWYVRLSDSRGNPRPMHEIIADLLHASGMDVSSLPAERQQLTGVLRSRLADRRVLIVLDDVHDSAQVADLLPGTPSSAVLSVHRAYLPDLVAVHGARVLTLDLLSHQEAEDVFTAVLGREPAAVSGATVAELVDLCGRLPLALRIAGGHLAGRPWLPVETFVRELREGDILCLLDLGNSPSTAVSAAFSVAYRSLPAMSRRFFRLLGGVSDMSFTAHTAAQLADCSPSLADRLLDKLAAAQLVEVETPGTYRFHNLIGLYAAERGVAEDTETERREALDRLYQWYLRRTDEAVQSCYPGFIRLHPPLTALPRDAVDPRAAHLWLRAEHGNLMVLVVRGADARLHESCVRLVDMLRGYFMLGRLQSDWLTAAEAGLRAAEALGDRRATAVMRLGVGLALQGLNDLEPAARQLENAQEEFVSLGVKDFEVVTVNALAMNQLQQPTKHIDSAITLLERGLRISRSLGLRHVEARGHMYLGMARHTQGDLSAAEFHFRASASILREHGVHRSRPEVLARLGMVHGDLGNVEEATEYLSVALALSQEFNAPHSTALASYGLAQVHAGQGRVDLAYQHAECAVSLSRDQGYTALEANARNALGAIHLIRGRSAEAREEFVRTLEIALRIGHPQSQAQALIGLGRLELDGGRPAEALTQARRAASIADTSGLYLLRAQAQDLIRCAAEHSGAPPAPPALPQPGADFPPGPPQDRCLPPRRG
ncbi:tetratricopeptide repeat protein [Streptomyces xanthophaeus]|nr:tetratricopeptide repeat protein [Streptomyces xanthophaeus]